MELYGALWSPMEPYGALWSLMEPYGALALAIPSLGPEKPLPIIGKKKNYWNFSE